MEHEARRELVSRLVDGELDGVERREVEAHLAECSECARSYASMRALKAAVARLPARVEPPQAVHVRVEEAGARARKPRGLARVVGTAIAAAAAIALTFALWSRPDETDIAGDLVADHLRSVPSARPVEVSSSEPHEIESFFQGRVPFAPVAPQLPGARLVGGRLCIIRGHAMQLLFYERGDDTLSLFVSADDEVIAGCEETAGHTVCERRSGGVSLRLVGRVPPSDANALLARAEL